jgi:hypothetical protein
MTHTHDHGWSWDHSQHTPTPAVRGIIAAVLAWSVAWKGFSLWRAAKDDSRPWFVALLITNTAGILDAVYLFAVSPRRRRAAREESSPDDIPPIE